MCVRERENKAIATFSLSTYLVFPSVSDQKISKVSQVTVFVNDSILSPVVQQPSTFRT